MPPFISLDGARCKFPLRFDRSRPTFLSKEQGKHERAAPRASAGTLDLLILRTLQLEPQHGWAISERIQQVSSDALRVQQGSLYPALHRLERRGWIRARWGTSENNRRAKYYELTKRGRAQLESETDAWRRLALAVGRVLDTA
jgi:transcriptional regulator